MKTAIIIPVYNEIENIERLIKAVFTLNLDGLEIIVVDDNSPDNTGNKVKSLAKEDKRIHLIERPKKMGLGTAYVAGFKYALSHGAEYLFEMDADFSHNPEMLPKLLAELETSDLVIGSRYLNGISIVNWPLRRLILSCFANAYARAITGLKLTDVTSGFKGYRKSVLEKINLDRVKSNGYAFQIEMKYRAKRAGFSLKEIPIIFVDRHSGTSKISRHEILEAMLIVWRLRIMSLIGKL